MMSAESAVRDGNFGIGLEAPLSLSVCDAPQRAAAKIAIAAGSVRFIRVSTNDPSA